MKSESEVFRDLQGILKSFQDREYSGEMTPETWFFADLGFASIDAVILGEVLERHYGQRIPFNHFLADLNERQVQDLSLGELSSFLSRHLR